MMTQKSNKEQKKFDKLIEKACRNSVNCKGVPGTVIKNIGNTLVIMGLAFMLLLLFHDNHPTWGITAAFIGVGGFLYMAGDAYQVAYQVKKYHKINKLMGNSMVSIEEIIKKVDKS